jgi:Holliday junction resolvase-like predicted endonuclease
LQKQWFKSADKRIIGQYLQKFTSYNSASFDFLGVTPNIVGTDQNVSITFRTSSFVGTVPLRSPDTGKQIGDFVVVPRYSGKDRYEDYIEILNLLGNEISPETTDSLPLASGRNFRPPMYLEASKFICAMEILIKHPWRKFDRLEKTSREPAGQINWSKYLANEYKVERRLSFPVGKNILSELHKEYSQIRYVFDICKRELMSPNTPLRIKLKLKPKLSALEEKLYLHRPLKTSTINQKSYDSPAVMRAKKQANSILNFDFVDATGWRVDFAEVFEKFVQHIFKEVAKELGGRFLANYKLKGYSSLQRNSWELSHLEPDGILQKDDLLVFVDAKYKSHLYNKFNAGDSLKDSHRHDLHQIMAYSSFSTAESKIGMLCYPSRQLEIKQMKYINQINQATNSIKILGIPLEVGIISEAKRLLLKDFLLRA